MIKAEGLPDVGHSAQIGLLGRGHLPYLYQGEELGLPEVLDLPEDVLQDPIWARSGHTDRGRDGCRVPIPWSGDTPPYAFTTGHPWLPMPAGWAANTAASQAGDPGSTLELYRAALRERRTLAGAGPVRWLDSPPDTLVFARDPGFVCAVNLGPDPVALPRYARLPC